MNKFILLSIFAYLLGSINFGYLIAKIKRIDLIKIGSGSPTSTNVARALGWRFGILSAILDFSKGVIPTYLATQFFKNEWQIIIVALLPIFGHIFPIFFQFRGGRGAATFFGASLVLVGLKTFLIIFLFWIVLFFMTKIASLTNLIFSWLFSIFLYFSFPLSYFIFGILGTGLMTFALRYNIQRLIQGEEPKIPLKF